MNNLAFRVSRRDVVNKTCGPMLNSEKETNPE